jgi:ATP-dependent helicase/nuclease subunit B
VLAIPERDGADLDIDPRDEGRIGHAVLERFLRERRDAGALPLRGTEEECEALRGAAAAVFERFAADGRVGDAAVWAARRAAVLARLERVVRADADAADGLSPALLEYGFGGDTGVPPLVLGEGDDAVFMRGRLDRVDAAPGRLLLIDYKDSRAEAEHRKKLDPDALGETNFQVPAYLMAAARALPGRSQVAATYLLLRSAERLAPFRASSGDPLFAQQAAARAAARDAGVRPFADAVVEAVRSVRAGALPIASRDCGGCPFGAVCRAQALAEEAA